METQVLPQPEKKRSELPFIVLLLIPLIYLAAIWNSVPDTVPLHFNAEMKADDYGSKWTFVALTCGIAIPVYFLLLFIPKLDPKHKIKRSSRVFFILRLGIHVLLCAVSCWIIYITANYGRITLSFRIIPILMSAFMVLLGNYMPTIKQNYFLGFRTPWTLENNEVWIKTHLVAGKAFFYAGLVCLAAGFLLPGIISVFVVVGAIVALTVYGTFYSYFLFRKISRTH